MRRRNVQPPLDLVPVMGLAALLIPLLLLGQGFPLAAIDANVPAVCACHGEEGAPHFVPTVVLHHDGIEVFGDGEDARPAQGMDGLTALLGELKSAHETSGALVLVADSDVPYERLIDAMDASRPHFPTVTVASGTI